MAGDTNADAEFSSMLKGFNTRDLDFVRHNETDYDAFREFAKAQDERFEAARRSKDGDAKRKNYLRWLDQIPERWRKSSFRTFDAASIGGHQSAADAAKRMLRAKQRGFFISGPHTTGKTYLAFAMIREFVAHGKLKPSQIKVITEGDLLSLSNGGFETRDSFDAVFDPGYKCYLFDSLGTRKEYEERREAPALTRLIEEAYNRSALLICTSHMDFDLYESGLPEQAAAKLRYMVKDGIIYTGQPLYGKTDIRRESRLDVDLYNRTGELNFSEEIPADKPQKAHKGAEKSSSSDWRSRAKSGK